MPRLQHTIIWHGDYFRFERLGRPSPGEPWAVWHFREFIGTMPNDPRETTKEFEARAVQWISELLTSSRSSS